MTPLTTTDRQQANCSIARALGILGDRWAFLILREAFNGVTRFADFKARLGIAPNILTARLHTLIEAGVLERRAYRDDGSRTRHSYHLTDKGTDLKVVLGALQQWGDAHVPRADGPTVIRRSTRTGAELSVGFVSPSGRLVRLDDVVLEPVPGSPADHRA